METEIVSPAYQGSLRVAIFHSGEATTPPFSPARSTPVGSPKPISFAYLAIRSIPSLWPIV